MDSSGTYNDNSKCEAAVRPTSPMESAIDSLRTEVAAAWNIQEGFRSRLSPVLIPTDSTPSDGMKSQAPGLEAPMVSDIREMASQLSRMNGLYSEMLEKLHI